MMWIPNEPKLLVAATCTKTHPMFAFRFQGGNLYSWVYKATLDNNNDKKIQKKKRYATSLAQITEVV